MSILLGIIVLALLLVVDRYASGSTGSGGLVSYQNMVNLVQVDQSVQLAHHRKAHRYKGRLFVFDPRETQWYAYNNGRLIRSGRASGGAHYCHDVRRACRTPVGSFRVSRKGGANCISHSYPLGRGGARMDYCMFFTTGYAIHGSGDVPDSNVSHGCIRVLPDAARWLNQSFLRIGTKVIVKSY